MSGTTSWLDSHTLSRDGIEMNEQIERAVREAGSAILEGYYGEEELLNRSFVPGKMVTAYDLESERIIMSAINSCYPDHNILSEESGMTDRGSPYTWLIDPLDGTNIFCRRSPYFCISVALKHHGVLQHGIIYAPAQDEFYNAQRGSGTYLNGHRVSVSTKGTVQGAKLLFSRGADREGTRIRAILGHLGPDAARVTMLGSAALEAAWISSAKGDACLMTLINPWDIAAGVLLVQESGGIAGDFEGRAWKGQKTDLMLSNGLLHEELLAIVARSAHQVSPIRT